MPCLVTIAVILVLYCVPLSTGAIFFFFIQRLVASFYQFLSRDPEKREQGLSAVTSSLHRYNDILQRQKTKYFQGITIAW